MRLGRAGPLLWAWLLAGGCERWSADASGAAAELDNATGGSESVAAAGRATGPSDDANDPSLGTGGEGTDATAGSGGSAAKGGTAASDATSLPYTEPEPGATALTARTWRLTNAEYRMSVGALLEKSSDEPALDPELDNGVYPNMSSSGIVRTSLAHDYYYEANRAVERLTTEELRALVPGGKLEAGAKDEFVRSVATRAFRRPVSDDELATYAGLFELGASEGDAELGFRTVLRALLTSPNFLYKTEIGDDPEQPEFSVTGYEIASLLAYGLTGEPPSTELLASAADGTLAESAGLERAVRGLLETEAGGDTLRTFASEWLKLERFQVSAKVGYAPEPAKDLELFPDFDDMRAEMRAEADDFLAAHATPSSSLGELLTSQVPQAGLALGAFYASDSSATSAGERTGVLALGAVLAVYAHESASSPTERGHFVRERLLCQPLSLPSALPPDLSATAQRAQPKTTRELYELHAADPTCAGCHALLDDVGFAFESFDAAGRFRESEQGATIDTASELSGTDVDTSFADHGELMHALARSEWVRECVATQAFRRYFGLLETERGIPPIQAARHALAKGSFADMLAALFGTESSWRRSRE